jgi:hypothetical protein
MRLLSEFFEPLVNASKFLRDAGQFSNETPTLLIEAA